MLYDVLGDLEDTVMYSTKMFWVCGSLGEASTWNLVVGWPPVVDCELPEGRGLALLFSSSEAGTVWRILCQWEFFFFLMNSVDTLPNCTFLKAMIPGIHQPGFIFYFCWLISVCLALVIQPPVPQWPCLWNPASEVWDSVSSCVKPLEQRWYIITGGVININFLYSVT